MSVKEERKARLDAIDIRGAMSILGVDIPNAELYKQSIANKVGSEDEVVALEEAAKQFLNAELAKDNAKATKRLEAEAKLLKLGLTVEDLELLMGA